MLRLSKMADYGTVIMVHLAQHQDKLSSASEIAAATHIALPTASKLLKNLTKSGLLLSVRGSQGGYRLQKSAEQTSVAEIIFALEEKLGLTECAIGDSDCSLQPVCSTKKSWRIINRAIVEALSQVSLANIVADDCESALMQLDEKPILFVE